MVVFPLLGKPTIPIFIDGSGWICNLELTVKNWGSTGWWKTCLPDCAQLTMTVYSNICKRQARKSSGLVRYWTIDIGAQPPIVKGDWTQQAFVSTLSSRHRKVNLLRNKLVGDLQGFDTCSLAGVWRSVDLSNHPRSQVTNILQNQHFSKPRVAFRPTLLLKGNWNTDFRQ